MQPKIERNKLIVKLIDKGWSIRKVAYELRNKADKPLSPSTVHEIYHREKAKKPVRSLSTGRV